MFAADGTQTALNEGKRQQSQESRTHFKGMRCETPGGQVFSADGAALANRPRTGANPPRPQSPWATTAPRQRRPTSMSSAPDGVISEGGALLSVRNAPSSSRRRGSWHARARARSCFPVQSPYVLVYLTHSSVLSLPSVPFRSLPFSTRHRQAAGTNRTAK